MVCYTLTKHGCHLQAYSKGNRSPIADPRMRGSIVGLTLVSSLRITKGLSPFLDTLGLVAERSRA